MSKIIGLICKIIALVILFFPDLLVANDNDELKTLSLLHDTMLKMSSFNTLETTVLVREEIEEYEGGDYYNQFEIKLYLKNTNFLKAEIGRDNSIDVFGGDGKLITVFNDTKEYHIKHIPDNMQVKVVLNEFLPGFYLFTEGNLKKLTENFQVHWRRDAEINNVLVSIIEVIPRMSRQAPFLIFIDKKNKVIIKTAIYCKVIHSEHAHVKLISSLLTEMVFNTPLQDSFFLKKITADYKQRITHQNQLSELIGQQIKNINLIDMLLMISY